MSSPGLAAPSPILAGAFPWRARLRGLAPALAALSYPFWLDGFHASVDGAPWLAALLLLGAFAVPALGIALAWKGGDDVPMRRLAYASVMAPTLYVFLGVLTFMLKSRLPDELIWSVLWVGIAGIALASPAVRPEPRAVTRWRVVHGATAVPILFYIAFHIVNHLFFLGSPARYDAVQRLGETVYRNAWVQPLLVLALLLQTVSGVRLFWHWSARCGDFIRTVQLATGIYLAAYVVGHMDSVFVFARTYLAIPSDWAFATGAPAGIIRDAWNIRLLPHYFLGAWFVLVHVACGARGVLLAHGARRDVIDRAWWLAVAVTGSIALAIMLGMAGWRV